ncbi:MAG: GTPase HflX [Spirochaetes bacterium RBG_13_51_14]|nr:MAG: GTPase HflX [Spirochaetes bacterium RBG_13_51_14]
MDASVNRIPSSKEERALVFGIRLRGADASYLHNSLDELDFLLRTAGAVVVGKHIVNRDRIDPSFIVGKGYLSDMEKMIREGNIKLVVFDLNAIRPAQVRSLEDRLKCRVVGRTEIIMDIFARRARSADAKIQVELAQLRYILPRLKGLGGVLSRLGGGVGTRGPGEKMLETDRRHIVRRIASLNRKLDKIKKHRDTARKSRRSELIGAVVGYTNSGKSTLINRLAKDDLFVEDRLFATLDSYTRAVYLAEGRKCLLIDTVGFIRNLPANLVESFKSTLEEIQNADFLIHVVDISSTDINAVIQTVNREIYELGCATKQVVLFFNKADLLNDNAAFNSVRNNYPGAIIGSASRGAEVDELKDRILNLYDTSRKRCADRRTDASKQDTASTDKDQ